MAYLADYTHSASTEALLLSLVPVICPPTIVRLRLGHEVIEHIELSMRSSEATVRTALIAGIAGYDLAAFPKYRKRASALDTFQATDYFESWLHSKLLPQHEFAKGLKGLFSLAAYEQSAILEKLGYTPGEWIEKSKAYRFKTYSAEIAARDAALLAADPLPNVTSKSQRK